MNTVLVQIKAILNSRPLTPMSSDPSDLIAITPSHFLIGRTPLLPSSEVNNDDATRIHSLSHKMRIQTLKGHFWKRYKSEYIAELQKRQKWRRQGEQLTLQ